MTDGQRRKNHYGTSHQVRKILRYRRILHRRETFVFLDIVVKLVVCAVAVIPTSKKYLAARRKRQEHSWDASIHSSIFDHENEMRNNMRNKNHFVPVKTFYEIKNSKFCPFCIQKKIDVKKKQHSV